MTFLLAGLLLAAAPPLSVQERLVEIADYDAAGKLIQHRVEIKFDDAGRRLEDILRDARGILIARERFSYDKQGRLTARESRSPSGQLLWKWTAIQHNANGEPVSCKILDGRGRDIGANRWHYDDQQRMRRRERFNRDGSLRFAYDDIEYDTDGRFKTWVKYDDRKRKISEKRWKYVSAERPGRES